MEHNALNISDFLNDIVSQLPESSMFIKDINGAILWHNSYCITDLKQSTNNLNNKTVFDLFSNESRPALQRT